MVAFGCGALKAKAEIYQGRVARKEKKPKNKKFEYLEMYLHCKTQEGKKKRMINAHAILEKPCAMRGTCAEKSEKVLYVSTPSNDLLSWQAVSADS